MQLNEARAIAENLVGQMEPFCEKILIAGSIRRACDECRDVEICVVPKWEQGIVSTDLFGSTELLNCALTWAFDAEARGVVQWIKPGTAEIIQWEPKRDGKYWRGILPEGVKLDLFLCTLKNWGVISLIRTGSAQFSHGVAAHAQRIGRNFSEGYLTIDGVPVATPDEETVFEMLGLEYVMPHARFSSANVVAKHKAVLT